MDNRTFNEIRNDLINSINAIYDPKTHLNFDVDPNSATDLVAIYINSLNVVQVSEITLSKTQGQPGTAFVVPDWNQNFTVTLASIIIKKL